MLTAAQQREVLARLDALNVDDPLPLRRQRFRYMGLCSAVVQGWTDPARVPQLVARMHAQCVRSYRYQNQYRRKVKA